MKTLVIHPTDKSTDCLSEIYKGKGFDVLRESNDPVDDLLYEYERIIMLGHGSPGGLFSVGRFPGAFAIDGRHAKALKNKSNIYVWCHASDFVKRNKLRGFTSGMFISEVYEARFYDIVVSQDVVTDSNDRFSKLLGLHLDEPWKVIEQYTEPECDVVNFNRARLEHVS